MKEDSITDWMQAVGTVGALLVTGMLALAGYFSELKRRGEASRNAILLADLVAYYANLVAIRMERALVPGPGGTRGLTPALCEIELESAEWLELLRLMEEVSPIDLPNIETSRSYVHIRSFVRKLESILKKFSSLSPSGRNVYLGPVDISMFQATFSKERVYLARLSLRALHPLWPRWMLDQRLKKLDASVAKFEAVVRGDG